MDNKDKLRCSWCGDNPLYISYHDNEWGVPLYDENRLFEMLVLEGAQAGLSWVTILGKRESYRRAFNGFDAKIVADYGEKDLSRLMSDQGIVRNRSKIEAAVNNAKRVVEMQRHSLPLSAYLWSFVEGKTIQNSWERPEDVPAQNAVSEFMSRDMKKRGFKFVGPTICYALMQSIGMVNDHLTSCYRHQEVKDLA
ncbi:MAG: DNA-3-methyladenine glycosylase I [Deltaproteobacteria bacterium]|nr:MAG: DNA-3-methyladenine glycosylase I [Deltaproteobacteria bacterium]